MNTFSTKLIDRSECGEDAVTFRFERPQDYRFTAGQYAVLHVEGPQGPVGKPFTIASAPSDDWLEFTTRISESAFKQALDGLAPGAPASVSAPAGKLVLPPNAHRIVFLVGGVGITPARSMLRDAVVRGLDLEVELFYGNRSDACIPYRRELEAMGPHGVRVLHVLEHAPDGWAGESGFITAELVRRHGVPDSPVLWIAAGPPVMVEAMERVLNELEVPDQERMIERFAGYA